MQFLHFRFSFRLNLVLLPRPQQLFNLHFETFDKILTNKKEVEFKHDFL